MSDSAGNLKEAALFPEPPESEDVSANVPDDDIAADTVKSVTTPDGVSATQELPASAEPPAPPLKSTGTTSPTVDVETEDAVTEERDASSVGTSNTRLDRLEVALRESYRKCVLGGDWESTRNLAWRMLEDLNKVFEELDRDTAPTVDHLNRAIQQVAADLSAGDALTRAILDARTRSETVRSPADVAQQIFALGLMPLDDEDVRADDLPYEALCEVLEKLDLAVATLEGRVEPPWLLQHVAGVESVHAALSSVALDPSKRSGLELWLNWLCQLDEDSLLLLKQVQLAEVTGPIEAWQDELERRTLDEAIQHQLTGFFDGEAVETAITTEGRKEGLKKLQQAREDTEQLCNELERFNPELVEGTRKRLSKEGLTLLPQIQAIQASLDKPVHRGLVAGLLKAATSLDEIQTYLDDLAGVTTLAPGEGVIEPIPELVLDHPVSFAGHTQTPTVTYTPGRGKEMVVGQGLGHIQVPVRLKVRQPPPRFKVEFRSKDIGDIPQEELQRHLVREFRVGNDDVHATEAFEREISLTVPATSKWEPGRPGASTTLELTAVLTAPEGTELAQSNQVTFGNIEDRESVEIPPNPLAADWVSPEEVSSRPIGVQRELKKIKKRLVQGQGSFFVAAPRRFGKTLMIQALKHELRDEKRVKLVDVMASTNKKYFWGHVEEALATALNTGAAWELGSHGLAEPTKGEPCLFSGVRKAAAAQGIETIWLLVDEAQRLFTGPTATEFGDVLKDRLESDLVQQQSEHASIRIGFFGQPHLRRRMGANLRGHLQPCLVNKIKEEDLEGLLRAGTREGLQSSSQARKTLAAYAENFWVLRQLLDVALELLEREGRVWLVESDVETIVEELLETHFDELWTYIRDPLNQHEDQNRWHPSAAYPVALAAARVSATADAGSDPMARLNSVLQAWSDPDILLPSELERQVVSLRDLYMLEPDSLAFRTEVTRKVLERKAATPFADPEFRSQLSRLTVGTVSLPPSSELKALGRGQQAEVHWEQATNSVFRVEQLEGSVERRRFFKLCEVYRNLRESLENNPTSQQFFPRLIDWGFVEGTDDKQACLHYRFVQGMELGMDCLDAEAVAWVGLNLCSALEHLERHDVVHRDIKPENVLLRTEDGVRGTPVLIDFGLARVQGVQSMSSLVGTSRFLPPEVIRQPADWSPAGDLYSLGKTLEAAAKASLGKSKLSSLIRKITSDKQDQRGTAAEARSGFEILVKDLRIEDRRQSAVNKWDKMADGLGQTYAEIAEKQRDMFVALETGFHFETSNRFMLAGQLLGDLFEAYAVSRVGAPRRGEGRGLLALRHLVRDDRGSFGAFDQRSSEVVGKVRAASAHPGWKVEVGNAQRKAGRQFRQCFVVIADQLDRQLENQRGPVKKLTGSLLPPA
jgi:hypothetical protein